MKPQGKSRILPSEDFGWKGVEKKQYKAGKTHFRDIHRYTLLGDDIPELNFQTRYFEIQPEGYSSLEYHRHPHSVVVIRGAGSLILENELHGIGLRDVIYIAPGTLHQFHADAGSPLGFLCMVDRYRDRPVIPDEETIRSRITSPDVLEKIRK